MFSYIQCLKQTQIYRNRSMKKNNLFTHSYSNKYAFLRLNNECERSLKAHSSEQPNYVFNVDGNNEKKNSNFPLQCQIV